MKYLYAITNEFSTPRTMALPICAQQIENIVQEEQCDVRTNEQLLEFFYLLKKKKSRYITDWLSRNADCIHKSISGSAHEYCGYTLLHFAVLCSDVIAVGICDVDCTIKNKNGQTPLHLGMTTIAMHKKWKIRDFEKHNMITILKRILATNNYINAYDNMGLSYFHIACYIGDYDLVKGFLLRIGANLNMNNNFIKFDSPFWPGYTAIHVACKYAEIRTIELFVEYGANITVSKDAFGLYPIHYAIQKCQGDLVDFLHSSSRIHFLNSLKSVGMLPMHVYCAENRFFYTQTEFNDFQFEENINVPVSSDSPMWAGCTPLHVAIHEKCRRLISILIIDFGANINARDNNGLSALQLAIRKGLIDYDIMVAVVDWYNIKASQPIDVDELYSFFSACIQRREKNFREMVLLNKSNINKVVPPEYPLDLPGYSPLHFGVEASIKENVELLIKNGADPCIQDANQMTPLHLAVLRKNIGIAKIICSYYGNVTKNPIDSSGLSHMHIACICDEANLIKKFLDHGVMVNLRTKDGRVPLHFAVSHGSETTVKLLLEHNADFTAQDINGLTPLHLAVTDKKINIAEMILTLHSKKIVNPISSTGLSHFHLACMMNKVNLVESFMKSGLVNHDPVKFDSDLFGGFTPLHFAVKFRCVDTVRLLLDNGASVAAQNAIKKLPLHYTFCQNHQECKLILDLLWRAIKSSGAKLIGTTGLSHLHIACMSNDRPAIDKILKQDPNSIHQCTRSDCPRWPGYSPLHFSAKYGDAESIKLLISHNKNLVHSTDIYGFTSLHVACSSSRLENVEKLLEGGSDPLKNALNNLTPLRLGSNNPGIVQRILSQPFVDNQAGMTCFHVALLKNDLNTVKKFLEAGADPNKPIWPVTRYIKFTGWDPLMFAVCRQDRPLVEMLISHGAKIHKEVLEQVILTNNAKLIKLILPYVDDPNPVLHFLMDTHKSAKLMKLLLELEAKVKVDYNDLYWLIVADAQVHNKN